MKIADLSVARPGGAALRAAGYQGVIRYAAEGRTNVNITKPEFEDYTAHGILVGIVCEFTADFMLTDNGVTCAQGAETVCAAAGVPRGVTYFAADFDATLGGYTYPGSPGDRNMDEIAVFLSEAASVLGEELVGFYGSYYACYAVAQKLFWLKWFWQTEAWSGGMMYGPRVLYQYAQGNPALGVDNDASSGTFWGQRLDLPTPAPLSKQVAALPTLRYGAQGPDVRVLQEGMNVGSGAGLAVDGVFGPATEVAVRGTQAFWHLAVDGVAGPQTLRAVAFECSRKGQ